MKNQYLKQLKSNSLNRQAVDRLLIVFKSYGFKLINVKEEAPSILKATSDSPKMTELVTALDLHVCTGIRSWKGLIVGFPGLASDLSKENIETPYLRKILYPLMELFNRVQSQYGKLDCLYILGARFNEVFRMKMALLEYIVPNLVFLTGDLLKCSENAGILPKEQTSMNEAWIQRALCRQMSSGEYGMPIHILREKVNLKLLAYEVPTNEGTKNPERLDILAYDVEDKSLVAFEIKGETGRVELENLYLQGMSHRNWLEQNKRAIKFLFDRHGPKGNKLNTRKRVRLMLGFCGNKMPELFSYLKKQAKNRDKHLKIDFVGFELPPGLDGDLRLVSCNVNDEKLDSKPELITKESTDSKFAKMRWKPETIKRLKIPDCEYPIPSDLFPEVLANGGMIHPEYLLCWLQEYSATLSEGWEELEPAMTALLDLLAPDDPKMESSVEGDNWALRLGPVDLTKAIVTIQRGGRVLAAINPLENEELRLSIYSPLDADALRKLIYMSANQLSMGYDSKWEVALTMGKKVNQAFMAVDAGKSYTSIWEYGLGFTSKNEKDKAYYQQRNLEPVRAAVAATQLGVYYELGDFHVV